MYLFLQLTLLTYYSNHRRTSSASNLVFQRPMNCSISLILAQFPAHSPTITWFALAKKTL